MERDAFPAFGKIDMRAVTSADVLAMVRVVEARGALDVSRRLKQHVSQIYRFAIPQGWADADPAAHLADLLKPKPRVRHMARVGMEDLPELVRQIDGYDGDDPSQPPKQSMFEALRLAPAQTSQPDIPPGPVSGMEAAKLAPACGFRDHRAQHSGMIAISVPR